MTKTPKNHSEVTSFANESDEARPTAKSRRSRTKVTKPGPRRSPAHATKELPHSVSGFSLIELIFAVILLTVIVFGVVKLQTSTLALSNTQNNEVEAYFLANQGAEIVKGLGTTSLACASYPCTKYISLGSDYSLTDTPQLPINGLYVRSVEIEQITTPTTFYKVTVLVEWTDSTGEHKRMIGTDRVNAHAEAKRIIY